MPDNNQQSDSRFSKSNFGPLANSSLDSSDLLKFESLLEDLRQETPAQPPFHQPKVSNIAKTVEPSADQASEVENDAASNIVTRKVEEALSGLEGLESELASLQTPVAQVSQNQLLSDNRLAESVLECSRDAIAVLEGTKVLYCNSLAEALFGFDRKRHVGTNLIRVIRQNFQIARSLLKETIQRLESGEFIEQEVRSIGSSRSVWYELKLQKILLADQERIVVMARDISKRKQYEIELARSRDFLNKTINAVPEPLSVKDSDLNIVLVNDAFCKTHDVRRERVIGKSAQEALPRSYSPEVAASEQKVLASGEQQASFRGVR